MIDHFIIVLQPKTHLHLIIKVAYALNFQLSP